VSMKFRQSDDDLSLIQLLLANRHFLVVVATRSRS
jgi:hypothetical protein